MHGNLAIMTDEISRPLPPVVGLGWCVLAVWSGQEWNVQRAIVDFPTYLPIERRIVVIRGRKLTKHRPLISGYLFVQVPKTATADDWAKLGSESLRSTPGTKDRLRSAAPFQIGDPVDAVDAVCVGLKGSIGFVKNNDKPLIVPAQIIEKIQAAENSGVFDYTGRSPFNLGDNVEIIEGQWAGLIGKIKSASPRKRAKILMGSLIIDVDITNLKKAGT